MSEQLNLALVQTSLVWEDPQENRRIITNKIADLATEVDLIVLPEMFTTGFTMSPEKMSPEESEKTLRWMKQESKRYGAAIVGSVANNANGIYTNRLYFVEPNGKALHYDKRHTFTLAGEDKVYKAGNKKLIVDYKGFRICPMVCYDLRFPVWARNVENYDLLLYVANWPQPRINAWDTLLKARAIENMAYCVGVNRIGTDEKGHSYNGHSAVYDCLGEEKVYSDQEEVVYTVITREHIASTREKLGFLEDRDDFSLEL
ncbi:amidohydrolase [Pseudozobellia sp. WGM2]|uniref:amidohydrolase n=1 Tax=Pseudozobellia sp. WGM2 TaxID=2787625 RepID=UPI001ADFA901|nr:amidohydrolase [Pseudozobellia sp. WGM2]